MDGPYELIHSILNSNSFPHLSFSCIVPEPVVIIKKFCFTRTKELLNDLDSGRFCFNKKFIISSFSYQSLWVE